MSFEPTELQLEILRIVDGLQHGKGREDVRDGSLVVLREGVPTSIILAEMYRRGYPVETIETRVYAAVQELRTRGLLNMTCTRHQQWWELNYRRPDGLVISTRICPQTGNREVLLDGSHVADETAPGLQPRHQFACYHITGKGIAILDPDDTKPPVTDAQPPKRWEPSPGYVGTKTITTDERFRKNSKNPPQSTMQRWVKRSEKEGNPVPTVKAPDSGEKFYPEQWVQEQIERWNPQ